MKRLIVTATLATLIASPAFAQSNQYNPNEGPYLGIGLGHATLDFDIAGYYRDLGYPNISADDNDTSAKLFIGYQFNPNFAVEASHVDFGDFTANGIINGDPANAEVSADGFGFALVGRLPIQGGLSVHGKLGMFAWDGEHKEHYTNDSNQRINASYSSDDTDPFYGVGAEYVIDGILIRGEVERYDLSDSGKDFTIDLASISLGYRF